MMDDDDEYLYGGSVGTAAAAMTTTTEFSKMRTSTESPPVVTPIPQAASFDKAQPGSGIVALLETEAENADAVVPGLSDAVSAATAAIMAVQAAHAQAQVQAEAEAEAQAQAQAQEAGQEEVEQVELGEESDEEDDEIEFIMEPPNRSLDFRTQNVRSKPSAAPLPSPSKGAHAPPQPTLTTEYTPMPRGGMPPQPTPVPPPTAQPTPQQALVPTHVAVHFEEGGQQQDGVDTSTLPPATAPPSHPAIDPTVPGILDGRSIFEVDMANMTDKPWRRPGSDISDWFNYGFDELSWEAYCYRRRELGEMANVLKANLITFTGMPEDQLSNLPPEVRQMVMTGMTALMNAGGPGPGMMGPGVMMDMANMMGPMGMGMGLNGDMGMGNALMQMQEGGQPGVNVGVGVGGTGTPEQVGGMMQDGFSGGAMNMGMGGDFGMQEQQVMGQQMYQTMEGPTNVPSGPAAQVSGSGARGATPVAPAPYRGRVAPTMPRGRGFPVRGRVPTAPRPASPLPPNVPTGPRNQNKYKDRDGNAPAVDGLDYGGGGGGREGGRTPSGEPEERSSSRKRRSSPGLDDLRGSKRR
ncbi:hypothetical protein APHAL10511_003158 [Amanita phalloides]|nr:hypothetical protein APHAL10511_003158 [Amanita phalloides]